MGEFLCQTGMREKRNTKELLEGERKKSGTEEEGDGREREEEDEEEDDDEGEEDEEEEEDNDVFRFELKEKFRLSHPVVKKERYSMGEAAVKT